MERRGEGLAGAPATPGLTDAGKRSCSGQGDAGRQGWPGAVSQPSLEAVCQAIQRPSKMRAHHVCRDRGADATAHPYHLAGPCVDTQQRAPALPGDLRHGGRRLGHPELRGELRAPPPGKHCLIGGIYRPGLPGRFPPIRRASLGLQSRETGPGSGFPGWARGCSGNVRSALGTPAGNKTPPLPDRANT